MNEPDKVHDVEHVIAPEVGKANDVGQEQEHKLMMNRRENDIGDEGEEGEIQIRKLQSKRETSM